MAHYDVAILGGGPGGYLAAERLAKAHLRVALIEKGDIGGTCLNIGCIPTKTLLNSAKLYTHAKESSPFGIETEGVRVNWQRTLEWKNEVVTRLRRSLELTLKKAGVEIVRGSGILTGAKTIEVRPETKNQKALSESAGTASADLAPTGPLQLEADQIIIATGSSPILPPIPGTAGNPAIKDSTGLLSLSEIPQKLCIIGGGVIGVEFASLFSALGSRVTVIEMMDEIVPVMDPQMAMMLRNALKQVTFLRSTKVTAVNGNKVEYQTKTGEQGSVEADIVLMSVGRKANIEGWGAQEAGFEIKNRSIATDEHMRTNLPGVWAVGDVTGKSQLAHAAYRMAEVAVADILARRTGQHGPQIFVPETVPWALYSMPEAAGVGYTESEAKAKGYEIEVIRSPYGVSGRFIAENGFSAPGSIKIIMEKDSQRLLGIHLLGPYASEHIWGLALALERRLPLSALQNMVFPHPTVSEVIREAAWNAHK
ncbi:MAG: dihydrolipoyl dehydrogenase [Rectinema subterraneum]|uniref:dihydrolipoyl dehydrogenase n=1 Tax=Rectinema subterraneum TaxID=2653714 RepID=UPI003C7C4347